MPKPRQRTRTKKRISKTSPSGISKIHYREKLRALARCRVCGQPLAGITHLSSSKANRLNKSRRKIWRPYGGQLCHNCLKTSLRQEARKG